MLARRWTGHAPVGVTAAQRMLGELGQVYHSPTAPKGPACLSPTPSFTAVRASSHLTGACSHAFYHSDAETHVHPRSSKEPERRMILGSKRTMTGTEDPVYTWGAYKPRVDTDTDHSTG